MSNTSDHIVFVHFPQRRVSFGYSEKYNAIAVAVCSYSDNFNRRIARDVITGRLNLACSTRKPRGLIKPDFPLNSELFNFAARYMLDSTLEFELNKEQCEQMDDIVNASRELQGPRATSVVHTYAIALVSVMQFFHENPQSYTPSVKKE